MLTMPVLRDSASMAPCCCQPQHGVCGGRANTMLQASGRLCCAKHAPDTSVIACGSLTTLCAVLIMRGKLVMLFACAQAAAGSTSRRRWPGRSAVILGVPVDGAVLRGRQLVLHVAAVRHAVSTALSLQCLQGSHAPRPSSVQAPSWSGGAACRNERMNCQGLAVG